MNGFSLIKNTSAYKIFSGDKARGTLSHANLIVCEDEAFLENYLKIFAKTLACSESEPCNNCRVCKLIDSKTHVDVRFYPTGKKIVVADVDDIIEKSYFKPLETDKKIFVLTGISQMNQQAQNKLLKTLEEPPANTYLILGTTTVYPVLSTVLSRCKRYDIPPFSDEEIIKYLSSEYGESEKLSQAVRLSGGKLGEAIKRYQSGEGLDAENLAIRTYFEVKTSRDVARFSNNITKELLSDYVSSLSRLTHLAIKIKGGSPALENDTLSKSAQQIAQTVTMGALIHISDVLRSAEKSLAFNGNLTAVVDGVLFGILEGKHKWSKL